MRRAVLAAFVCAVTALVTRAQQTEGFHIDSHTAGQMFEGHAIRKLAGKWGTKPDMKPGGVWWEIRMDQPLGRLAFHLLEPASDDGLVAWNGLDGQLKDATTYPIFRTR